MDILILLVFVSAALVALAFAAFAWTVRQGSLDHSDRLSLLPLENDRKAPPAPGTTFDKPAGSARDGAPNRRAPVTE